MPTRYRTLVEVYDQMCRESKRGQFIILDFTPEAMWNFRIRTGLLNVIFFLKKMLDIYFGRVGANSFEQPTAHILGSKSCASLTFLMFYFYFYKKIFVFFFFQDDKIYLYLDDEKK